MAIDRGYNGQSRVYMDIRPAGEQALAGGTIRMQARGSAGTPPANPARRPSRPASGRTQSASRRQNRTPQKGLRGNLARKPSKLRRRDRAGRIDISFFFLVIVLVTIGLIMVFSASYATSLNENDSGISIVMRQIIFVAMGLVAMFVLSYIPYHLYQKLYRLIYIGCIGLTALALVFEDRTGAGARRWIYLPGFSFQPSELLKFALIVTFAALIARNYRQMDTFKKGILEFFYFLIPAFGVMVLQRHMSWLMLMVIICGGMMFIAGSKIYYVVALVPIALLGLVLLQALGFDYIGSRIDAWLDPFSDIQNSTWQIVQSLYAIGSGGLFGVGLGNSTQKFLWLSEPQNDFIFAVVCEELGLVGAIAIILLFVLFVASGFSIAMRAPDKFGSMLVIGIVLQFGVQALLNIAVVSNAMPTTGISLPFFSAGGTATMVQLAQVGIVLNVSRFCRPAISRKKDPEGKGGDTGEKKPKIKIISSHEI